MSFPDSAPRRRGILAVLVVTAGAVWFVTAALQGASTPRSAAQATGSSVQALPSGQGSQIAGAGCLVCHGSDMLLQQRLSRDGWAREVDKMIGWGAAVKDTEKEPLIDFLVAQFGRVSHLPISRDSTRTGMTLINTRCSACHGIDMIEQQRLGPADWTREVAKMVGWGANVSDEEKAALVDYLSSTWPVR